MRMCSIASGSSGNCIYIGSDTTHILIDAGISGKRTEEGLNKLGLSMTDVSAVLVSHEHADHIQGLGVLARKYHKNVCCTKGTRDAILQDGKVGKIDEDLFYYLIPKLRNVDVCVIIFSLFLFVICI